MQTAAAELDCLAEGPLHHGAVGEGAVDTTAGGELVAGRRAVRSTSRGRNGPGQPRCAPWGGLERRCRAGGAWSVPPCGYRSVPVRRFSSGASVVAGTSPVSLDPAAEPEAVAAKGWSSASQETATPMERQSAGIGELRAG